MLGNSIGLIVLILSSKTRVKPLLWTNAWLPKRNVPLHPTCILEVIQLLFFWVHDTHRIISILSLEVLFLGRAWYLDWALLAESKKQCLNLCFLSCCSYRDTKGMDGISRSVTPDCHIAIKISTDTKTQNHYWVSRTSLALPHSKGNGFKWNRGNWESNSQPASIPSQQSGRVRIKKFVIRKLQKRLSTK